MLSLNPLLWSRSELNIYIECITAHFNDFTVSSGFNEVCSIEIMVHRLHQLYL